MRIQVLPASPGATPGHPLTGLVIDGVLAVDAGPLGQAGTAAEMAKIEHVLLTHAHIDHVAGLPVFLDTVYQLGACPTVHCLADTREALQAHLFNGRLMPDFIGMSTQMPPFLTLSDVHPHRPFAVGRYTVTAMPLDHSVPTVAYLIDDGTTAVAVITDTAPVPAVIEPLARWPRLKAVFLECSFPRSQAELARISQHLTTDQFATAARQFPPDVTVFAIHIKPRYHTEVTAEVRAFALPNVRIADAGRTVEVGTPC